MRSYEVVVIFRDDNTTGEAIVTLKEKMKQYGIEMESQETWGSRELAYPIEKQKKGYYVIFNVKSEPEKIKNFENEMRIYDKILRYMVLRKNKKEE